MLGSAGDLPVVDESVALGLQQPHASASQSSRQSLLEAVGANGLLLQHLPAEMQVDREVVLAAIESNPKALLFAASELLRDESFVIAALQRNGLALSELPAHIQQERQYVLAAVGSNGLALRLAPLELRADRKVVLAAVIQTGLALGQASEQLRGDCEVVLAAVTQNGQALRFAAPELRSHREIVRAAALSSANSLKDASQEARADRDFMVAILDSNGAAWSWASDSLISDQDFQIVAARRDKDAYNHFTYRVEEGLDPEDVPLVMHQADCDRCLAARSLKTHGDLIEAIVDLTRVNWHAWAKGVEELGEKDLDFASVIDSKIAQPGDSNSPLVQAELTFQPIADIIEVRVMFVVSGRSWELQMDQKATVGDLAAQIVASRPGDMQAFSRVFLFISSSGKQNKQTNLQSKTTMAPSELDCEAHNETEDSEDEGKREEEGAEEERTKMQEDQTERAQQREQPEQGEQRGLKKQEQEQEQLEEEDEEQQDDREDQDKEYFAMTPWKWNRPLSDFLEG